MFYGLWAFRRDGHSGSSFAVAMIPITIAVRCNTVDVDSGMAGDRKDIVLRDRVLEVLAITWVVIICAANALA